jgi:MOSC domain-containing protein YiiM
MSRGTVVSLNISAGGVPKLPIGRALVTAIGVAGDGHHDLKHHGGPERAICIYSAELIQALRDEGHPIFPGSAGENITVFGLDWAEMAPAARVRVGEVLVEVTDYTSPCRTISASFIDGRFGRISQKSNPGWSRVYGKVVAGGIVQVGDFIEILPI